MVSDNNINDKFLKIFLLSVYETFLVEKIYFYLFINFRGRDKQPELPAIGSLPNAHNG